MKRRDLMIRGGAVLLVGTGATVIELKRMGSADDAADAQARLREALATRPALPDLIRYAALAPSGHNTQPWRFSLSRDEIAITPDFTRRTPVVDPDDHHLYVSLGCVAETLDLAALRIGQGGELVADPKQAGGWVYRFGTRRDPASPLFGAIARRQSTRSVFNGRKPNDSTIRALIEWTGSQGINLELITEPPRLAAFADLIAAGNSVQMANPAFIKELRDWLRFNARDAIAKGDGLFSASSGNPQLPTWLGHRLFDLSFKADAENRKYREQVSSAAGLAVFFAERADRHGWFNVGRACQRFALAATALGMKVSFLNQPVEVPELRQRCAELAGMAGRRPDIIMRFGFGDTLPYSFRRPIADITI